MSVQTILYSITGDWLTERKSLRVGRVSAQSLSAINTILHQTYRHLVHVAFLAWWGHGSVPPASVYGWRQKHWSSITPCIGRLLKSHIENNNPEWSKKIKLR